VVVVLQPDTSTTPSNTHIIRDACFIRRDFIGAPQLNSNYVKPGNNRATNFPVNTREYLREMLYGVPRGVDRRKKFLTKAGALPFVPRVATRSMPCVSSKATSRAFYARNAANGS
jgi:hypothetical protein